MGPTTWRSCATSCSAVSASRATAAAGDRIEGVRAAYIDDLVGDFRMTRRLRVVCATGNGTAGHFAPEVLERIGVEVIPRHTALDYTFPHYNPNPEALEMLHDMAEAVHESGADLALGFDGDGDRCGVVDDEGEEIFANKMGVILARDTGQAPSGRDVRGGREVDRAVCVGPRY